MGLYLLGQFRTVLACGCICRCLSLWDSTLWFLNQSILEISDSCIRISFNMYLLCKNFREVNFFFCIIHSCRFAYPYYICLTWSHGTQWSLTDVKLFLWTSSKGHSKEKDTSQTKHPLCPWVPLQMGKSKASGESEWMAVTLSDTYITVRKRRTNATVSWAMRHEIKGWCPNVRIQLASDLCLWYKIKMLLFQLHIPALCGFLSL